MTWSWTVTFMWRPASTRSRVRRMSCWLGGVAGGVVVDDDDRGRAERDGAGDDFADMDRGFVDRPRHIASFASSMFLALRNSTRTSSTGEWRHRRLEIIAERVPAREDRPAFDTGFEQAQRRRLGDLQRRDHAVAQAFAPQRFGAGRQQRADAAESARSAPWPAPWYRRAGWRG